MTRFFDLSKKIESISLDFISLESKIRVNLRQNGSFFDSSKKIESISLDFILLKSKN